MPPPALTFNVAFCNPIVVGVSTTLTVQVEPTGTDVPQLLVCEYALAFVPESVMPLIGSAALPLFVTVTDCAALAMFTCTLPNASDFGDTVKVATNPKTAT